MFRIQTYCNHILSAAEGFRGQEATCADPGIFVLFSSQLILQFTMDLLLRKLYLYFTKDPKGSIIFQGGGCQTFSRGGGVQMIVS